MLASLISSLLNTNETTSGQYEYSPLNDDEIRVVIVAPSYHFWCPVQCHIEHKPLDRDTNYDALSYTWGKTEDTKPILLNGHTFQVTPNLDSALRYLRSPFERRVFWIDAICINQSSVDERNAQVPRIARIYEYANTVIGWLGPEADYSDLAMKKLEELNERSGRVRAGLEEFDIENFYGTGLGPTNPRAWKAILLLMRRPWWKRMWIVQEITANADTVLTCGRRSISFATFQEAIFIISEIKKAFIELNVFQSGGGIHDYIRNIDTEMGCRLSIMRFERQEHFARGLDLERTLVWFRRREASDLRDKVYALLSLASGADDALLKPDYKLPVAEVYLRTMKHIVMQSGYLDILDACIHPNQIPNLPSWVPDWSREPDEPPTSGPFRGDSPPRKEGIGGLVGLYSADGDMKAEVSFNDSTGSMFAKGCIFDTVSELGEAFTTNSINTITRQSPVLFSWLRMAETQPRPYPTGENWKSAFLRTLVVDSHLEITGKTAKLRKRGAREIGDDLRICKDVEMNFLKYRRLVITGDSYMALAPEHARSGDMICVLRGGQMPFILRREGLYYTLIGECYVHGRMDAEVMQEVARGSVREEILEVR